MTALVPEVSPELPRYRNFIQDSIRWNGFAFRPGDIVISTPPKAGTTWTQMLCALLIFDSADLPRPLAELSPWLDQLTNDLPTIVQLLESQQHRRFIKTHTPLDGLPVSDGVTYLVVGRDPRDVAISWDHHVANVDFDKLVPIRAAAVGLDDLAELDDGLVPPPEDPEERFWQWVDLDENSLSGVTLRTVLHHLRTGWERIDDPQVALFHYSDLLADLPGQLGRLAEVLEIDVSPSRVEELADAATFAEMRGRADEIVPNSIHGFWRSNTEFFHRGESGQWRDLIAARPDGDARYWARVEALAAPDLASWAHRGWLGTDG